MGLTFRIFLEIVVVYFVCRIKVLDFVFVRNKLILLEKYTDMIYYSDINFLSIGWML